MQHTVSLKGSKIRAGLTDKSDYLDKQFKLPGKLKLPFINEGLSYYVCNASDISSYAAKFKGM